MSSAFCVHMFGEFLKPHLEARAEHHEHQAAEIVDNQLMRSRPGGMATLAAPDERLKRDHLSTAARFRFLADHISPAIPYPITLADYDALELGEFQTITEEDHDDDDRDGDDHEARGEGQGPGEWPVG